MPDDDPDGRAAPHVYAGIALVPRLVSGRGDLVTVAARSPADFGNEFLEDLNRLPQLGDFGTQIDDPSLHAVRRLLPVFGADGTVWG